MNKLFLVISLMSLFLHTVSGVSAMDKEAGNAAQLAQAVSVADERITLLEDYLYSHNSPLAGEAETFITTADEYGLDWKLVAAIAGLESTFGKRVPFESYNAWGWAIFTGQNDGKHFLSWKDGINQVSRGLRINYLNRGAQTLEQIGNRYAASPTWAQRVKFFMNKIENYRGEITTEDLDLVS